MIELAKNVIDLDMAGSDMVNMEMTISYDDVIRGSFAEAQAAISTARSTIAGLSGN